MVTVAQDLAALYPADNWRDIPLKGYINGNWGNFSRHWHKTTSAAIKPGMGVKLSLGVEGEDKVTEWAANDWRGYGYTGWDKGQIKTIATAYAQYDLIPIYPFIENPGSIFQGYVADTGIAWAAMTYLKAAATGAFTYQVAGASDYHTYAQALYYNPDTVAVVQRIVMKEFHRIGGGSTGMTHS